MWKVLCSLLLVAAMIAAEACDNRPVRPLDEEDASQTGTSSGTPTQPPADASSSDATLPLTDF